MTRYFITGAQGFVGTYLTAHLLQHCSHARVLGIGRSPQLRGTFSHDVHLGRLAMKAPLPPEVGLLCHSRRYRYVPLHLGNTSYLAAALKAFQPDVIFHLASGLRDDHPSDLFRTNVEGTLSLLEALAKSRIAVRKIVLGSTGGVYGPPSQLPICEDAPCNPIDVYSVSKLAAEHVARITARRYGLPVVWARLFNLAGPGQDERHICGQFAARAAAIAEGIVDPVIETGLLETTRDFVDVRDVVSGLVHIGRAGVPGEVYNLASGTETLMQDVLLLTLRLAGLEGQVEIRQKHSGPADIPRHAASIERIRALGCRPEYSLKESLADLRDYYRYAVCPTWFPKKRRRRRLRLEPRSGGTVLATGDSPWKSSERSETSTVGATQHTIRTVPPLPG